ncbi:alpha/beta hydrolase [Streptomyces sp. NBC_00335]|uniref:alpha/beta fold hydrolase n=1 Tax=unclassified Streptomyces TaxID=2593676 RepID=UPI002257BA89|nr:MULTISPECIES: alpha/beta fold hydrolase [unclassified Streptomyces]MCX5407324.1 alpha/beta hydrolase [Streptomyces sp. NBC_00086]
MLAIALSSSTIEYTDTDSPETGPDTDTEAADGPARETIVLVPGLGFDASVWQGVVDELRPDFRVLVPVLPIGGHRLPMDPGADLSAHGVAGLLAEFLDRLDLREVTLVQNDAGIAQLLVGVNDKRIARLVLASCEALDNYPPGLQGKALHTASKIPGALHLLLRSFRSPFLAGMRTSLGGMAKRPIPHDLVLRWYGPLLTDPAIRRDLAAFLHATRKDTYVRAAERLRSFDRPALVLWGAEDRMMPPRTGRRLAGLLPYGTYEEVPDARTLIPFDNPQGLCAALRRFIAAHPAPVARGAA